MARPLVFSALLLLGGCRACASDAPRVLVADPPADASEDRATIAPEVVWTPPQPTLCDGLRAGARKRLEHLLVDVNRAVADAGPADPLKGVGVDPVNVGDFTGYDACVTTAHGAWSLRFSSITGQGPWNVAWGKLQVAAKLAVVHTDDAGRRAEIVPDVSPCDGDDDANFCSTHFHVTSVSLTDAGDVDGDGENEVVLAVNEAGEERATTDTYRVYRFAGGAIVRLAPNVEIDAVRDVDGDGKVDLLYHPYKAQGPADCLGIGKDLTGVDFVAHASKAGFSRTDAIARRELHTACPAAPSSFAVADSAGAIDLERTATNIVCARAWDVGEDVVRADLDAHCDWVDELSTCAPANPRACPTAFQDWITQPPPLRL